MKLEDSSLLRKADESDYEISIRVIEFHPGVA